MKLKKKRDNNGKVLQGHQKISWKTGRKYGGATSDWRPYGRLPACKIMHLHFHPSFSFGPPVTSPGEEREI